MNVETAKYKLQRTLRRVGFDASRLTQGDGLSDEERGTVRAVEEFTMTPPERVLAMCDAIRYVSANKVPGAIVECGVWRGGMMMAAARTLLAESDVDRELYLYDTFAGMTEPTEADLNARGRSAARWMQRYGRDDAGNSKWCFASVEDVRRNVGSVGYPAERLHFVQGPVEETIPGTLPDRIAVLRLDTDWYESTAHEMEHLFPLLQPGGVLILDDYGHWQGTRRAVDEYLERRQPRLLLQRTDYASRMAVVPGPLAPADDRPVG